MRGKRGGNLRLVVEAAAQPVAHDVGVARGEEEFVPLVRVLGVAQEGGVHRLRQNGARVLHLQVEVLGELEHVPARAGHAIDPVGRLDLARAGGVTEGGNEQHGRW
eukprot:scaffold30848_cov30-Tisochrysis_lutea.AAC.1